MQKKAVTAESGSWFGDPESSSAWRGGDKHTTYAREGSAHANLNARGKAKISREQEIFVTKRNDKVKEENENIS
jgi:hypothetical protein